MHTTKYRTAEPAHRTVPYHKIAVGAAFVYRGTLMIRTATTSARAMTNPGRVRALKLADMVTPVQSVTVTYETAT